MKEPEIRKVLPDEIAEVWRVHVAASNDLQARRGRPAARPADASVASDARVALVSDPDGYFCAVEDGGLLGAPSLSPRPTSKPNAKFESPCPGPPVSDRRPGSTHTFPIRPRDISARRPPRLQRDTGS